MPSRFLNNITVNDQYTLPSTDGAENQIIVTDGAGNLSFDDLSTVTGKVEGVEADIIYYEVKNSTGTAINAFKGVMAVGTDGNSGHILIDEMVADGSVEARYFLGITRESIPNGGISRVIAFGEIDQINTNAFPDGTVLWCDPANPGDFTATEPDGPNLKIPAAFVLNQATNGKIQVRVQGNEGIKDLYDTKITSQIDGDVLVWKGTEGIWQNDSTLNVDYTNSRVGIGTTSPSRELDIDGNIQLSDPSSAAIRGLYGPNGPMITYNGLNFDTQIAGGAIRINPAFQQMNFKVDGNNDFLSHDGSSGETIFSYQGSEKMRINGSTGNVGIGTTNPGYKLDVAGDMNVGVNTGFTTTRLNFLEGFSYIEAATVFGTGSISMNVGSGEIYLSSGGNVGIGTSSPSQKLHVNGNGYFSGNVGIGTTSPNEKLEVNGSVRVTGAGLDVGYGNNSNNFVQIGNGRTTNGFAFIDLIGDTTYSDYGFRISRNNGGANTNTDLIHRGTGFLNLNATQAGGITLKTSNIERVRVNSSGNVGIATTSPRTKLHVSGLTGDDDPALGSSTAPLFISNTANSYGLNVGVNNAGASWLQAQSNTSATAYEMSLNPLGGNVGVGFINPAYKLDVNGTGRFTDTLYYSSLVQQSQTDTKKDIRLVGKENSTIPIKEYKYKTGDNDKVRYGVMAEDVESTYPELVETDAYGIKGVKYIDLLVRKIAELETEKRTLVNWRHYHSNTSYNTLYDTGMTTSFPYAYGSIPAPYDMYFTSVTLVNNPWSSYNKGPEGDTALFQAYVNGALAYEVRDIRYGQNPYESITADFGKNVRLRKGESLKIRFYANGMWRYCNSTIILTEV